MPNLFNMPLEGLGSRVALVPGMRPKDVPALGHDEMHVWIVGTDAQDSGDIRSTKLLSVAETQRAKRYKSDFDRICFVQRRAAQRIILAGYLDISPQDVVYDVNEFGKPSFRAPRGSAGLSFNTSHSGTVALIAVTRSGRIGIDVEQLRPALEDEVIAVRFFTPNEAASLAALHPRDRVAGFFNAWTRKEAVVKALGGGLSIPLNSFEVSLRPGEPAAILRWAIPGAAAGRWWIHHVEPAMGYVGALAADSATSNCQCWKWTK